MTVAYDLLHYDTRATTVTGSTPVVGPAMAETRVEKVRRGQSLDLWV